ncbi:hypothetical protein [Streptomyces griseoloalbus]|uniref:Secreted protein n=1 Tax=Streptomyces griseoloalbus TaxID=67303 RepID=A0A7W8BU32_9ACTN|nr:hypothetical protein [Streptomyces albaduncus]MBB5127679.1 hypothetical protein [Streptomyces albaduncus]GGW62025.1 hypothetical protein GCM10010340_45320 [Streptomyces albaduncus]
MGASGAGRAGVVTLASAVVLGLGSVSPGAFAAASAGTTAATATRAAVADAAGPVEGAGNLRSASGALGTYAFAEDARRIDGTVSTADAVELVPGRTYRSTLPAGGKVYYRLELDATTNVYASATAVPPAGRTASVIDGVKVSVEDSEGRACDVDTASFGAAGSPHPVAAWAMREISPRKSLCKEAGTYYVAVERVDPDGEGSSPDPWEMELTAVSEPPLEKAGATRAPQEWNSAPPRPVAGKPERRPGAAGFARATPVGQGVWRDDIRPGQTLFYKVPVDWGRQLYATAELGSSGSGGSGYVAAALDLDLYNPARGHVADAGIGYDGAQKAESLAPLPPVVYVNRHAVSRQAGAMRFAGSYYLVAHLSAEVADAFGDGPVPLTLRVRLSGGAQDGPGYAGEPVPSGVFTVTGQDRQAAAEGAAAGDDAAFRALAVGGIGTGSALLVGLGVWTLVARRRARS